MTRCHADPVEVLHRDEEPLQFLWHGRLHVVQAVLAHWVESTPWWLSGRASLLYTGAVPGSVSGGGVAGSPVGHADPASVGMTASTGTTTLSAAESERQVWRVDAGAGRSGPGGVFELTHVPADGRWYLTRVHD